MAKKNQMEMFEEEFEDNWPQEADDETEEPPQDSPFPEEDDVNEAYDLIAEIENLAVEVPERGEDFAQSVIDKVNSIKQTIETNERFTVGQKTALENMKAGLEKWIR